MWNGQFEYFQGRGVLPYLIALNQLERLKTRKKKFEDALPVSSPTRHSLLYEARIDSIMNAQHSRQRKCLSGWEIAGCGRSDSSAPLPLLHWEQISHLPFRCDLICFNRLLYGAPLPSAPPPRPAQKIPNVFFSGFCSGNCHFKQLTLPSLGAFFPGSAPCKHLKGGRTSPMLC